MRCSGLTGRWADARCYRQFGRAGQVGRQLSLDGGSCWTGESWWRPSPWLGAVGRDQSRPPNPTAEHRSWVHRPVVGVAKAEVEPGRRLPDHLPGRDGGTRGDGAGRQHAVRPTRTVGLADYHVARAGNATGEGDHATDDCVHRNPNGRMELETSVPAAVVAGRLLEADCNRNWHGWLETRCGETGRKRPSRNERNTKSRAGSYGPCQDGPCQDGSCQATPAAVSRARRCSTALVWICDTRLSVTPSTVPISASVRLSS